MRIIWIRQPSKRGKKPAPASFWTRGLILFSPSIPRLMVFQITRRFLWHIVFDHQLRTVGRARIAAVYLEEIGDTIVVVVRFEAQAELGDAQQVDIWEVSCVERFGIPIIHLGACKG